MGVLVVVGIREVLALLVVAEGLGVVAELLEVVVHHDRAVAAAERGRGQMSRRVQTKEGRWEGSGRGGRGEGRGAVLVGMLRAHLSSTTRIRTLLSWLWGVLM